MSHEPSRLSWQLRLLIAAVGALGLTSMVIARSLEPDPRGFGTHEQLGLTPCYFNEITGKVCPLCGGTTAWAYVLRGEILQAASANLAAMLLCVVVATGSLRMLWVAIRGSWGAKPLAWRVMLVVASAWLAVAVCDWLRKVLL